MADIISKAVAWIKAIAADDSHGYQWGGNGPGDYDCSGLVNAAWIAAGVNVNDVLRNTTHTIKQQYARHGFKDATGTVNLNTGSGLQAGDVLVNTTNHMAMYIGNGKLVQARSNIDGKPGDSSGQEIRVQSYYNYPWDLVMRYSPRAEAPQQTPAAQPTTTKTVTVSLPILSKGAKGSYVTAMQDLLIGNGFSCAPYGSDGSFGTCTYNSLVKYQKRCGLTADGICGKDTWTKLLGG